MDKKDCGAERLLVSWVAATDYRVMRGELAGLGPVGDALVTGRFAGAVLLNNYAPEDAADYAGWIAQKVDTPVSIEQLALSSPIDHAAIYVGVCGVLERLREQDGRPMTFHLSPGTPAMAAVWLLLSQTRFPAALIQSSRQEGVVDVELPFDIAVDFLPELAAARRTRRWAQAPLSGAFEHIVHRSPQMVEVLSRARRAARWDVPVLIEGESGTGKELLARAIHDASRRSKRPFIAVNCGAIPPELVESELFGHEKGSFTGATRPRPGHFRAADRGTLFLDEIGELPLSAQVKILRVLQEQEVTPVGGSQPVPVDVRIIAATHRHLIEECAAERFRFDLFYRLAVAVLLLPPLRERAGDLSLLIEHIMAEQAAEARRLGEPPASLSAEAVRVLQQHRWPGNVRELRNTLRRACLWAGDAPVSGDEIRQALLQPPRAQADVLSRPLGDGFALSELLAEVARHYLSRALDEAGGNKSEAARLVGLASYQTLTNWMRRYDLS